MENKRIKRDDTVLVVAGNDRGAVGTVIGRKGNRVVVKGVNVRKKHRKPRAEGQRPEIAEMEVGIHLSNVVLCDANGHRIRCRVEYGDGGEKRLVRKAKGGDGDVTPHRVLRKALKR
ncbi:MAG: 50S ribosomal protein L24 [Simkaniaceae bacterium]|nr:50S ribosomal protein L24 [Simkaniaceae bacterium]